MIRLSAAPRRNRIETAHHESHGKIGLFLHRGGWPECTDEPNMPHPGQTSPAPHSVHYARANQKRITSSAFGNSHSSPTTPPYRFRSQSSCENPPKTSQRCGQCSNQIAAAGGRGGIQAYWNTCVARGKISLSLARPPNPRPYPTPWRGQNTPNTQSRSRTSLAFATSVSRSACAW